MNTLANDLRYAIRQLARSPGFSAVAVLALGLGIGANTALFSVVNGVLLAPLPYEEPDRLVVVRETKLPQFSSFSVAPGNYIDWSEQQTTFESMAAIATITLNLTGLDTPEAVRAARVTASLFDVLGVAPAVGRPLTAQDDRIGADAVVVVSDGFGRRHFGDARNALGASLSLDGRTSVIVGVMPASFAYPAETEIWTPMAFTPSEQDNHGSHYMRAVARLAPDVPAEQALTELQTIARRLEEQYPDSNGGWNVRLDSLMELTVGDTRPALLVLLGAVAFVLLIACANVANMLLARSTGRQKEMAVRLALGAARGRIVRQLLTESLVLGVLGASFGVLLAYWGVQMLPRLAPRLPRLDTVTIDGLALTFTAGLALVTSFLFGLAPAVQGTGTSLVPALQEDGRSSSGGAGRRRMRRGLVIAEIALALVLLVGAGLLIRSFSNLQSVDPGFDPSRSLIARVELPERSYPKRELCWPFYQRLISRIAQLPGVESVGATQSMPFVSDYILGFHIDGRPRPAPSDFPSTNYYAVSPGYFEAMGIRLVRGRLFTERDREDAVRVAVINETLATRHFPGEDPIGHRIWVTQGEEAYREIVGIVRDVQQYALDVEPPAQTYEPVAQQPFRQMTLVARSTLDPSALGNAIRTEVMELDADLPVSRIEPLDATLDRWLVRRRAPMQMLVFFAGIAMLLAGIGIYGVLAYSVAQRTREVGIRMALGARPGDVQRLVIGEGMVLAGVGLAAGLLAALLVTRAMDSMLFGVGARDPVTFIVIPPVLAGVALVASYLPARRATRVDPVIALRAD